MRLAAKARGLVRAVKAVKNKQKRDRRTECIDEGDDVTTGSRSTLSEQLLPPPPKEKSRHTARRAPTGAIARKSRPGTLGKTHRNMGQNTIAIHEDGNRQPSQPRKLRKMSATVKMEVVSDDDEEMDEEPGSATESENEVDESVMEDMRKLEESFTGISERYRLINRIGEGTFSTVYKAEQLFASEDDDDIENDPVDDLEHDAPPSKRRRLAATSHSSQPQSRQRHKFVALKKIYVTSSPLRILNELELLHELRASPYICPLLTAFRHHDQVVAVLPYFRHLDFRLYYREFLTNDIRLYFKSLLSGLAHVHRAGILHRDIKPTNFLYDHTKRHGVLVDFGLAERQGTDWQPCTCTEPKERRKEKFVNSYAVRDLTQKGLEHSAGYPQHDSRSSRRANRAGTRGFRAPEVLFKCTYQTTKIDIWSTAVILLTFLARRFPFFNSADDVDAMIEMASIFGRRRMKAVAAMHGQVFETNIESIGEHGFTFEKLILWAACREKAGQELHDGELQAIDLLRGLMELDQSKRLSAKEALQHPFFVDPIEDEFERGEREAQEAAEEASRRQS